MTEGYPGADGPPGPRTFRRVPDESGDLALETPSPAITPSGEDGPGTPSGASFVEQGPVVIEMGRVVFGKYEVLGLLGRGGMGEVWLVRDVDLDVKRALKVISALNPEARERFRREARAMARFSHRNVVTVHEAKLDLRDTAYIVMEYIPGVSLEKTLKSRGGPMPLDWTLRVLTQLCEALEVAHRRRIIHRDLKPSNLILLDDEVEGQGEVLKVLDFGIAKILHAEEAGHNLGAEEAGHDIKTIDGAFMGTPPYASPEQAAGTAVPLSDIYSVGVILYEFLAGCRPFRGKPGELIAATIYATPPGFAEVNPRANVPPEVERVVLRCLAKDPRDRPQSARVLLEEFRGAVAEAERTDKESNPRPRRLGLTRRWAILIGAAVASAAVAAGVVLATLPGRKPDPRPVDTANQPTGGGINGLVAVKPTKTRIDLQGRPFDLHRGVYLPTGYRPDPKAGDLEGHSRVLVGDDGVRFFYIPGGRFEMGALGRPGGKPRDWDDSNQPAHTVDVEGFYIQEFEVTNRELLAFEKERDRGPDAPADSRKWKDNFEEVKEALGGSARAEAHPARGVSWKLAAEYARGRGAWLPTEAQWEYAARSGLTSRALVWDEERDSGPDADRLANIWSNPRGVVRTSEVGKFPDDRTLHGVMDMAGNVSEWCRDRWVSYADAIKGGPTALPDEPADDPEVVVRGGSYNTDQSSRYVTWRGYGMPLSASREDVGFRLVIECPKP